LHNIIAGKSRSQLTKMMQKTRSNIYLSNPLVQDATVIISGNVADALKLLKEQVDKHSRDLETQSLWVHAQKLDWIMTNRRDQVVKIVRDNGTHISFDQVDGLYRTISVSGVDKTFVERTVRMLTLVACECYVASIELSMPIQSIKSFAWDSPKKSEWDWKTRLESVAQATRAVILARDSGRILDIFGTESVCKAAFVQLCNLAELKVSI
jgi:hypothetical protein